MLRIAGGVMGGLVLASVAVMLVEVGAMLAFPLPDGVNPEDSAQLAAAMAAMPVGAFVLIAVGHGLGGLVGGLVAGRIGARTAASIFLAAFGSVVIANLMALPHPGWFWAVDLAAWAVGCGAAVVATREGT